MALPKLFKTNRLRDSAHALYSAIMGQARRPEFYLNAQIPDSFDGRFDLLVVHVFLVMRRLKQDGGEHGPRLSQYLYDVMFADMDRMWREQGVGDIGVGHRVNRMSKAFLGRIVAYETALESGEADVLADALRRNLYGSLGGPGDPDRQAVLRMVEYVRREDAALAGRPLENFVAGAIAFGPPPGANGFDPPPGCGAESAG